MFTRRQALAGGFSPDAIDRRLADGSWIRIHRGVYGFAGLPRGFESRVLAAILAVGIPSNASHETAGMLWQLVERTADVVHVAVPDSRRVRLPGITVHRPLVLSKRDVTRLGPLPVTTPARSVIDLAHTLTRGALEEILDEALRRDLVGSSVLLRRVRGLSTNGRRGLRTLEGLLLERSERGVTGSKLEDRFRRLLSRANLPEPIRQFEVRDASGRLIARVDFAYPAPRIAIEIDGYAFHSGRRAWQHDLARQNALVDAGWLVLRFTSRDITRDGGRIVSTVRRALERRLSEVT